MRICQHIFFTAWLFSFVGIVQAQTSVCNLRIEFFSFDNGSVGEALVNVDLAVSSFGKKLKSSNASRHEFGPLQSGNEFQITARQHGYKITHKVGQVNCGFIGQNGLLNEVVLLWKGNAVETVEMTDTIFGVGNHGENSAVNRPIVRPKPEYPAAGRAVKAKGAVSVQVIVDEIGRVAIAKAVSGHPLLRASAMKASMLAKFRPTLMQGIPVKVSGIITYNFVP